MQITLDIPANQANRVLNAMCARYGYNPDEHGNGQQAKIDFAKQYLISIMVEAVAADEADVAVADYPTKRTQALAKARSEITIT